jgi:hypothetical protein
MDKLVYVREVKDGGSPEPRKWRKAVRALEASLMNPRAFLPHDGERCRQGKPISTARVESAVHQGVSKRSAKKQQRRWTRAGRPPSAANPDPGIERERALDAVAFVHR